MVRSSQGWGRGEGFKRGMITSVVTRWIFLAPREGGGGLGCDHRSGILQRKTNEPVLQTKNDLSYSILDQNCCCRSRLK